jgi:hypothetical protein
MEADAALPAIGSTRWATSKLPPSKFEKKTKSEAFKMRENFDESLCVYTTRRGPKGNAASASCDDAA